MRRWRPTRRNRAILTVNGSSRLDKAAAMPQTRVKDKQGKSPKWQARRHEIVDTSAKVFAERGYHATSTTELCEANGIGKGALYYYIGSKEQLLAAIHDRVMDEVMLGADRVTLAGGTPPSSWRCSVRSSLTSSSASPTTSGCSCMTSPR